MPDAVGDRLDEGYCLESKTSGAGTLNPVAHRRSLRRCPSGHGSSTMTWPSSSIQQADRSPVIGCSAQAIDHLADVCPVRRAATVEGRSTAFKGTRFGLANKAATHGLKTKRS